MDDAHAVGPREKRRGCACAAVEAVGQRAAGEVLQDQRAPFLCKNARSNKALTDDSFNRARSESERVKGIDRQGRADNHGEQLLQQDSALTRGDGTKN